MNIELKPEDRALVEDLIAKGRFSSTAEVISASLVLMRSQSEWMNYAKERIEAGMDALEQNDFTTEDEIDALFDKYRLKSA